MTAEASMGSHVMLYSPPTAHGDLQQYGSYWRPLKGAENTRGDCGAESTRVTVVLRARNGPKCFYFVYHHSLDHTAFNGSRCGA